ncbi:nitroreductase [Fretibacter rubidus]|uniref:nitroreductase n=1 Tax=Fretibacter rubidus TaxID=570162 RepID=UPI003529D7DF
MPLSTSKSVTVSDALDTRITVRKFRDTPVPEDTLMTIMEQARRTASGGNLQPWQVHVMTGQTLKDFVADGVKYATEGNQDEPTHPAYPSPLWEPQRSWRYKLGEDMYKLLGIAKDDKFGRMAQFLENMKFFGAPVGIIITADKRCQAPQHMDVGIYVQSLMLLAREHGLHTAPQGWWRNWPTVCEKFLDIPEEQEVIVGMSLGYGDPDVAVNDLRADRAPLSETHKFYS